MLDVKLLNVTSVLHVDNMQQLYEPVNYRDFRETGLSS